jgi:hypothetical protein
VHSVQSIRQIRTPAFVVGASRAAFPRLTVRELNDMLRLMNTRYFPVSTILQLTAATCVGEELLRL